MSFDLNNIIGEYITYFTGGAKKGGASPGFEQEIQDAVDLNGLLQVVNYYFRIRGTGANITVANLNSPTIATDLELRPDRIGEYRANQVAIADRLINFSTTRGINGDHLKQLSRITLTFSQVARAGPGPVGPPLPGQVGPPPPGPSIPSIPVEPLVPVVPQLVPGSIDALIDLIKKVFLDYRYTPRGLTSDLNSADLQPYALVMNNNGKYNGIYVTNLNRIKAELSQFYNRSIHKDGKDIIQDSFATLYDQNGIALYFLGDLSTFIYEIDPT